MHHILHVYDAIHLSMAVLQRLNFIVKDKDSTIVQFGDQKKKRKRKIVDMQVFNSPCMNDVWTNLLFEGQTQGKLRKTGSLL